MSYSQPIRHSQSTYPSTCHFISQFNHLLQTRQPIANNIENIIPLLSITNYHSSSRINRNVVYEYFSMVDDLMGVFKMCVLVNRLICSRTVPDCSILLQIVCQCYERADVWLGMGESSYKFLKQSILQPYIHYLKKRAHDQSYHEAPTCQCKQHSMLSNNQNKQVLPCIHDHFSQCYYIINLMTRTKAFCFQMLALIRYYGGYFGCILDFNISIGMDMLQLYERLSQQFEAVEKFIQTDKQILQEIVGKDGLDKFCHDAGMLAAEIQVINEGLYVVYYNCYYGNYLKTTTPKFINTDKIADKIKKIIQKKQLFSPYSQHSHASQNQKTKLQKRKDSSHVRCLSTVLSTVDLNIDKKNKSAVLKPQKGEICSIHNLQSVKNVEDKKQEQKQFMTLSSIILQKNEKQIQQQVQSQMELHNQEGAMNKRKKIEEDVQLLLEMSNVFEKICEFQQQVVMQQ